jgi:hypothetical protein
MMRRRKTHCYMGHEYTPENTKVSKSGRACKTCQRINDRLRFSKPKSGDRRAVRAQ